MGTLSTWKACTSTARTKKHLAEKNLKIGTQSSTIYLGVLIYSCPIFLSFFRFLFDANVRALDIVGRFARCTAGRTVSGTVVARLIARTVAQ